MDSGLISRSYVFLLLVFFSLSFAKTEGAREYRVRTQRGFLNTHSGPGNPFRTDNIIGRWHEDDIVDVSGKPVDTAWGPWLQTSKGWSIQHYAGFHWLQPVAVTASHLPTAAADSRIPKSTRSAPGQGQSISLKLDMADEGILRLAVSFADGSAGDLGLQLKAHREALEYSLESHFGFATASVVNVTLLGRRRLAGAASTSSFRIYFRTRGIGRTTASQDGLTAKIQQALISSNARLAVRSASVVWLNQAGNASDNGPDGRSQIFTWGSVLCLVSFFFFLLAYLCFIHRRAVREQNAPIEKALPGDESCKEEESSDTEVPPNEKSEETNSVASISTSSGSIQLPSECDLEDLQHQAR